MELLLRNGPDMLLPGMAWCCRSHQWCSDLCQLLGGSFTGFAEQFGCNTSVLPMQSHRPLHLNPGALVSKQQHKQGHVTPCWAEPLTMCPLGPALAGKTGNYGTNC